jgi:hypothetical protein
MSPVRYELGFYIPEDGILHSYRREILKSNKSISDATNKGAYSQCRHIC